MKNTHIYIIVLVLLVGVAVYLYLKDERNTLDPRLSDFSIDEDEVESLDSILLTRGSATLKLHRTNNRWYMNRQMYAREQSVEQFLNVLQDLQVEAPAQRSNRQELLEIIRSNSIRIRIYSGKRLLRDYLLEDSEYKKGTSYMMMTGSGEPFLMGLPGYSGDLADLFSIDPSYWRDKTLFDYSGVDIKSIQVRYPSDMRNSFYLTYGGDSFRLRSLDTDEFIQDFNSSRAARYFSYFSNVRFEKVIRDDQKLLDSLDGVNPYCVFEIHDTNNKRTKFITFRKKSEGEQDAFGQESYYDLNYLYGCYDGAEEILLIKYTEFDPLLKEINYFREK